MPLEQSQLYTKEIKDGFHLDNVHISDWWDSTFLLNFE